MSIKDNLQSAASTLEAVAIDKLSPEQQERVGKMKAWAEKIAAKDAISEAQRPQVEDGIAKIHALIAEVLNESEIQSSFESAKNTFESFDVAIVRDVRKEQVQKMQAWCKNITERFASGKPLSAKGKQQILEGIARLQEVIGFMKLEKSFDDARIRIGKLEALKGKTLEQEEKIVKMRAWSDRVNAKLDGGDISEAQRTQIIDGVARVNELFGEYMQLPEDLKKDAEAMIKTLEREIGETDGRVREDRIRTKFELAHAITAKDVSEVERIIKEEKARIEREKEEKAKAKETPEAKRKFEKLKTTLRVYEQQFKEALAKNPKNTELQSFVKRIDEALAWGESNFNQLTNFLSELSSFNLDAAKNGKSNGEEAPKSDFAADPEAAPKTSKEKGRWERFKEWRAKRAEAKAEKDGVEDTDKKTTPKKRGLLKKVGFALAGLAALGAVSGIGFQKYKEHEHNQQIETQKNNLVNRINELKTLVQTGGYILPLDTLIQIQNFIAQASDELVNANENTLMAMESQRFAVESMIKKSPQVPEFLKGVQEISLNGEFSVKGLRNGGVLSNSAGGPLVVNVVLPLAYFEKNGDVFAAIKLENGQFGYVPMGPNFAHVQAVDGKAVVVPAVAPPPVPAPATGGTLNGGKKK